MGARVDCVLEVPKGCWWQVCSGALCICILKFMIWSLVPLPCRNPACSSAISVLVLIRMLYSMIRTSETRATVL